jgi:hypothetical protein
LKISDHLVSIDDVARDGGRNTDVTACWCDPGSVSGRSGVPGLADALGRVSGTGVWCGAGQLAGGSKTKSLIGFGFTPQGLEPLVKLVIVLSPYPGTATLPTKPPSNCEQSVAIARESWLCEHLVDLVMAAAHCGANVSHARLAGQAVQLVESQEQLP